MLCDVSTRPLRPAVTVTLQQQKQRTLITFNWKVTTARALYWWDIGADVFMMSFVLFVSQKQESKSDGEQRHHGTFIYMYNYSRNNATYVLHYHYFDWWPFPYKGIALHESGIAKFLSSSAALMTGVCWWCPYKMTSAKITSNDWRQSSCNFPGDWLHVWWHCSTSVVFVLPIWLTISLSNFLSANCNKYSHYHAY